MSVTMYNGSPHLSHAIIGSPYRWEMFKDNLHGWSVLCWGEWPSDRRIENPVITCCSSHEFGENLLAALKKFAEVHQTIPE